MDKDKKLQEKQDWSWLPAAMPGVTAMIAEKRREWGSDHVNLCWQRGVLLGQPGWFFAREGALMVGTPSRLCDEIDSVGVQTGHQRCPLVLMKEPEGASLLENPSVVEAQRAGAAGAPVLRRNREWRAFIDGVHADDHARGGPRMWGDEVTDGTN